MICGSECGHSELRRGIARGLAKAAYDPVRRPMSVQAHSCMYLVVFKRTVTNSVVEILLDPRRVLDTGPAWD